MKCAFLLYPHQNVRYRQSLLTIDAAELSMTLAALGRGGEVRPVEMGGAAFLTFDCDHLTQRDVRMLSELASVYVMFTMEDAQMVPM